MNTSKIAAFYPSFLDILCFPRTGRSFHDQINTVVLARQLQCNPTDFRRWVTLRDQDNPVEHFDELGMVTDEHLRELVSPRVFEWVCRQQPAEPVYSDDVAGWQAQSAAWQAAQTGWQITANEVAPSRTGILGQAVPPVEKGRYCQWTGSAEQLATVLRGLRAQRTKRHKQVRKLLAQLMTYHWQQQKQVVLAGKQEGALAL